MMPKLNDIEVLTESTNGCYHVKFVDGEYSGMVLTFGDISFTENEDQDECVMSYHYDVIHNPLETFDEDDFKQYVGDLLIEMIQDQLEREELIYAGGVDNEDRAEYSEQSDSERGVLP